MAKNTEVTVLVLSRTSGATWEIDIFDSIGNRRDLLCADEGCSHADRRMAELEQADIVSRLASRGIPAAAKYRAVI
jgi:ATP-dependent helicase YprA (DUF1998 family)